MRSLGSSSWPCVNGAKAAKWTSTDPPAGGSGVVAQAADRPRAVGENVSQTGETPLATVSRRDRGFSNPSQLRVPLLVYVPLPDPDATGEALPDGAICQILQNPRKSFLDNWVHEILRK